MASLTVGSGLQFSTLSSAIAASQDGDTIYVQAGAYLNDFATINTKVSIIGVGGMVHLTATQFIPNGKAILVTNTDVKLDHIEFSGAMVADQNGAGIRYQGGDLTITNSYFHNNENGILAAAAPTGTITIDNSEFGYNGFGDGRTHNLYIGEIANLTITDSYFHDANVGHEIKSRAESTTVLNSRIIDGASTASYSIDLPNGGAAVIQNNFIHQGVNSQNPAIINYGGETPTPWANSSLLVSGNTFFNERSSPSLAAVSNWTTILAQIIGNSFYGLTSTQIAPRGPVTLSGNVDLTAPPAIDNSSPWAPSPWDGLIGGTAGADLLAGTSGRDLFVGSAGNDTFEVRTGGGSDTIADFAAGAGAGDVAKLDGYALADFAAVLNALSQSGTDSVLNLGSGETLTFKGVLASTFAADDFLLVNVPSSPPLPPPQDPPTADIVQPFELPVSGTTTTSILGTRSRNVLNGTNANDRIDGQAGADTMSGGAGDDVYLVENLQDTVVENPGQGIDTVISSAKSHALGANVENLTLTGKNAKTGTGNALDNLITLSNSNDRVDGGAGNDIIVAGSGAGRLTGGLGHDMFVFSAGGQDQVMDFHIGEDLIDLRPLMQKVGYSGGDPIADGFLAITADSSDGLIVSARLTPSGSLQGIANVLGVSPDELRIGLDLLWDDNGTLV